MIALRSFGGGEQNYTDVLDQMRLKTTIFQAFLLPKILETRVKKLGALTDRALNKT